MEDSNDDNLIAQDGKINSIREMMKYCDLGVSAPFRERILRRIICTRVSREVLHGHAAM